jgi:hypothetical protein
MSGPARLVHDPACELIKTRNMNIKAKIKCSCAARKRQQQQKSFASGDAGDWDNFATTHEDIGGGNYRTFVPSCD